MSERITPVPADLSLIEALRALCSYHSSVSNLAFLQRIHGTVKTVFSHRIFLDCRLNLVTNCEPEHIVVFVPVANLDAQYVHSSKDCRCQWDRRCLEINCKWNYVAYVCERTDQQRRPDSSLSQRQTLCSVVA